MMKQKDPEQVHEQDTKLSDSAGNNFSFYFYFYKSEAVRRFTFQFFTVKFIDQFYCQVKGSLCELGK